MSLRRNTVANYLGQGYSALIGIAMMPLYLELLGAEAFGLVGFFVLMQAWLTLLDFGLSPTLARQAAVAKSGAGGMPAFASLLRSMELIFALLAVLIVAAVTLASSWIAADWIRPAALDGATVVNCIVLMGMAAAMRLLASLYRSGFTGLEELVWLNAANTVIVSVKFIGAYLVMRYLTADVMVFFAYQLGVGVLEVAVLATRFYRRIGIGPLGIGLKFDWPALRAVAPFALSVGYASALWLVVTQIDKLILSGLLTLSEFGYFSVVSLIAGGILVTTAPVSQAILPRMTGLHAQGKTEDMLTVYRNASQLVTVIAFSIALFVGMFAEALIYAWTGDTAAAEFGADVLLWFALGNAVLAVAAFQFYLQSAFGELRLHVIGTTISALLQVPVIYFAALHFGAQGAGIAWCTIRIVWFLVWTPIVHVRLVPGFHLSWMGRDILPIMIASAAAILLLQHFVEIDTSAARGVILLYLLLPGMLQLAVTAAGSRFLRRAVTGSGLA